MPLKLRAFDQVSRRYAIAAWRTIPRLSHLYFALLSAATIPRPRQQMRVACFLIASFDGLIQPRSLGGANMIVDTSRAHREVG